MKEQFCMVLTTTNCQEFAQKIIDAVLEQRLAACIQTIPIQSSYWWEGQVHSDNELLLVIKTKTALYEGLEEVILLNHNYELPEIVHTPITKGFDPYLVWLDETTRS